jgi:hypothetical protein
MVCADAAPKPRRTIAINMAHEALIAFLIFSSPAKYVLVIWDKNGRAVR